MVFIVSTKPEKLNEWGDALAGFAAPLAFLWLVLGYLQQGDELRQSTNALRLQAEELRHSVEQQSALVEVSRQQVQQDRQALDHQLQQADWQRKLAWVASRPRFIVTPAQSMPRTHDLVRHTLQVMNKGAAVTDLRLVFEPSMGPTSATAVIHFGTDEVFSVEVDMLPETKISGTITFTDANSQRGAVTFAVQTLHGGIGVGPIAEIRP